LLHITLSAPRVQIHPESPCAKSVYSGA